VESKIVFVYSYNEDGKIWFQKIIILRNDDNFKFKEGSHEEVNRLIGNAVEMVQDAKAEEFDKFMAAGKFLKEKLTYLFETDKKYIDMQAKLNVVKVKKAVKL
jgi:purine nucleoside permease